jgi:hypothetical protein
MRRWDRRVRGCLDGLDDSAIRGTFAPSVSKGLTAQGVPEGTQGGAQKRYACGTRGRKRGTPRHAGKLIPDGAMAGTTVVGASVAEGVVGVSVCGGAVGGVGPGAGVGLFVRAGDGVAAQTHAMAAMDRTT